MSLIPVDGERALGSEEAETVVQPLPPGREWAAAATLAASHADYPSFRRVFAHPARRGRALPPFFAATIRDAMQVGVVRAVTEGPRVLAVAIWLPPGAFPWSG